MAAEELHNAGSKGGPASVLSLSGSGACRGAVYNTENLGERFFTLFGATQTTGNYSCQALQFTASHLFGTKRTGLDPATLDQSGLIILWGANIASLRFGSSLVHYVNRARERGIPVIVIDPRKSSTAKTLATEWIPINPGSDRACMAAILYVLFTEGLADRTFLQHYTTGSDTLEDYILGKSGNTPNSPEWASPLCGIDEQTITDLARRWAKAEPVALLPGFSIQRTLKGEDAVRYAVALQAATGNIGRHGGSAGAQFWLGLPGPDFPDIPVPPPPEDAQYIPVYRWAEESVERKINLIYNIGTNLLNQGSNIDLNRKAFSTADFVVTHELFLTPSARYSDLVLPVASFLEREDVVYPSENYLYYSARAVDPLYDTRTDYDILADLSNLVGLEEQFTEGRTAEEWLNHLAEHSEVKDMEHFRRTGIYDGGSHERTAFTDFRTDPAAHPLATPSGKIEIVSRTLEDAGFNIVPQAGDNPTPPEYPFRLITPHCRYRVNSQNSNLPWFRKIWKDALQMAESDAAQFGIKEGVTVTVQSPDGELKAPVTLSRDIMPGTVCFHQGSWYDPENGYPSANMVTSATPTMPSFGSRTHTVFVRVKP